MLKNREEVWNALKMLDGYLFSGQHKGRPMDRMDAMAACEALVETFREDKGNVTLHFHPPGTRFGRGDGGG